MPGRSGIWANRLRRRVLVVVVSIILLPMLLSGVWSAHWIGQRTQQTVERWVRESGQASLLQLQTIQRNVRLFAELLEQSGALARPLSPGESPVPQSLQALAKQLGIGLVQLFDDAGHLRYSSQPVELDSHWNPGQAQALLKVRHAGRKALAAVTILRYPADSPRHLRLVIGTLFDKQLLQRLGRLSGLKVRLYDRQGGRFSRAFSDAAQPLALPREAIGKLLLGESWYSHEAEGGGYLGLYTPLRDASGRVEAVLFSGLIHNSGVARLADTTLVVIGVALFGGLLAGLTGLLISRLVVQPVRELSDAARALAAQDFRGASVPVRTHDELGELAATFNGMAVALHEARDQQRRDFQRDKLSAMGELSMALAHEIRNPVGVINTASKLLGNTNDEKRRTELTQMIHEECQRLDQFLKDFQQLARHRQPQLAHIDPAAPLQHAAQRMLAGRDDIELTEAFTHGELQLPADLQLLQQAWSNLLRNALEALQGAGQESGRLLIGSRYEGRDLLVYLQDDGPGVPAERVGRLFEPFYTTKDQGSGLGLTLANTLAEACGASLELVPDATPGACFAMRFKLEESD